MSTLPPAEQGPPGPPFTQWERLQLQLGAPAYVQRDDQLCVRTRASVAVPLVVAVRLQQPEDGRVVPMMFTLTTVADRTEQLSVFTMAEGFLMGVVAFATDAAMIDQAVFVDVGLLRGGFGLAARVQGLVSGPLDVNTPLAWPHITQVPPTDVVGRVRLITGAAPAAGAESIETVPAGARWLLRAWRIELTTAAAVGNRQVHLLIDNGVTGVLDHPANGTQAATLGRTYNAGEYGFAPALTDDQLYIGLTRPLVLEAGYRIRTLTTGIAAADQYAAPVYQVVEQLP